MTPCGHCPRKGDGCRGLDNPRLCELVDPSRPEYDERYIGVLALPEGEVPPPPVPKATLAASLRALKLGGRRCWYASAPACGCSGLARCHRLNRDVSLRDCLDCLKPTTKKGKP